MAAAFATQGIASVGNAYAQSQALKAQGNFQKQAFETNSHLAELQAEDAIKRGDKEAGQIKAKARQMIGTQRAALAAQGIDVNSGSARDIQEDTAAMSELDALTIKNNAFREAWGYKVQALDFRARGQFAELSARTQSRSTLLTGGMQAIGYGLQSGYYARGGGVK